MTSGTRARGGSRARDRTVTLLAACAALAITVTASAQEPAAPPAPPPGSGALAGRVVDAATGAPIEEARVIVTWPTPADDGEPHEEVETTDAHGDFRFAAIPAGSYSVELLKPGYTGQTLRGFAVRAGETARADVRLAPGGDDSAGPPSGVEEILVLGARVEAMEASRQESDEMINTLTAADISKFAATDVADVILRIPGVNVVEGQFAIIRGLEDRYSSTLYNNAPIPSPDPDRQSPQLDLFPTEIVSDLVVVKTFGPEFPSNSSGGSINVLTTSYPEDGWEVGVKSKGGFNTNAVDDFWSFEHDSPVGDERDPWNTIEQEYGGTLAGRTTFRERDVRYRLLGNWSVDYDTAFGYAQDKEPRTSSATPGGDLENGELTLNGGRFDLTTSDREEQTVGFGAFGFDFDESANHGVDISIFWTKRKDETIQLEDEGYFPELDYLAPDGPYDKEVNQGTSPDFENFWDGSTSTTQGNATLASWIAKPRNQTFDNPERGFPWFASFYDSKSFDTKRDLLVPQINGRHTFDLLPDLQLSWVGNYAKTTQEEDALGARMWYEPCGFGSAPPLACPQGVTRIAIPTEFPVKTQDLGPGKYVGNGAFFTNDNKIDEHQWFGRLDGEYATELSDWFSFALRSGGWYERAQRDIDSNFLESLNAVRNPLCQPPICFGDVSSFVVFGDTLQQLGRNFQLAFNRNPNGDFESTLPTQSDAEREIRALGLGGRTTWWEDFDVFGGLRFEKLHIESNNDPFVVDPLTGQTEYENITNTPAIFPSKFLMFDRFGDNQRRESFVRPPPYNDEVLGLGVNVGPCRSANAQGQDPTGPVLPGPCVDLVNRAEIEQFVNGQINETKYLPSVGLTYRPVEGLALRAAWSQTVARPSFREMGYYVSVEPATDDLIIGNPQLQLSDVESWDGRIEYFFGDAGDLVAIGGFYKRIEDPIESIILRDPTDFLDNFSSALYRTFFNNPNEATLWGIEFEARKSLGFLRAVPSQKWLPFHQLTFLDSELVEFVSIGGNFTWIDAEVDRTEPELQRSLAFFPQESGETLDTSRRLYGQPEWMANADITFDHPDWGTRATLAFYGISDVLDAAGAATILRNGQIGAITLDRYIDSFHTLDLVVRQELWSDAANGLAVKFQARNLTNSRREIVYDPAATSGKIAERSYKEGRDFSFELSYTFSELPFLDRD